MAEIDINGSTLGSALQDLLMCDNLEPGDSPSYQLCKTIYSYHPLGAKMAEAPISMAQSQNREVTVPDSPEDFVRDAFNRQWIADAADRHIFNVMRTARIYGIASVACLADGTPPARPLDYKRLYDTKIAFNILDPLNTAGSLVLDQNPNELDFQKHASITISGQAYHRSRSCTILNEDPLYIEYTQSAFGFVGRSVYQRPLYPLKSFIQSMVTDDLVTLKAGVLIAKIKSPGSIVDRIMLGMANIKRQFVKEARTGNVISIEPEEFIESLDLKNLEGPFSASRKNIIKNIATAADMPAIMLENETLTEGFGEGTEDAKAIARYVDRIRIQMKPLYDYFDKIVQYRAWNPEFYKTVQAKYPEVYGAMGYTEAFYRWTNSFVAVWPNLLTEPDSEKIKTDDVKLKASIAGFEVLYERLDPKNRVTLVQWLCDSLNSNKLLFPEPLVLDMEALEEYEPEVAVGNPGDDADVKMNRADSGGHQDRARRVGDSLVALDGAIARLPQRAAQAAGDRAR